MVKTTDREDKIKFNKSLTRVGNSDYILLPAKLKDKLGLDKNDDIEMQLEHTEKHGFYVSFWNPDQQE